MTDPAYERHGTGSTAGALWKFEVDGLPGGHTKLMFFAQNIRMDRTEKAFIKVGFPGEREVANDDLELRSDAERGRLANRAAEHIWGVKYQDKKAVALRERLMLFCGGLYEFWIGEESGDWVEGDAQPSAPRWDAVGLSLAGATGIHVGDAKAGKSTLLRLIAVSQQHDLDHVIPIRTAGPGIWVNAEEPRDEFRRQVGNINAALGLPRTAALFTIHAHGMPVQAIVPRVEKAAAKINATHVDVDSLSRLAQGMNLNENATATLLIDAFSALGLTTTFIGHTGQENRFRLAGSKHFENAARLVVLVQSRISRGGVSPELTRGLRASVTHANGAAPTEPLYWTLRFHRDYGLASIEKSSADEWPVLYCDQLVGQRQQPCGRETWDGLMRNGYVRCPQHRPEEFV